MGKGLKDVLDEKTIPVLINRAPWNELLLRGKRHVKTLSFPWKHRGLIFLYTSKDREDPEGWWEYGLEGKHIGGALPSRVVKGAIVGTAMVTDVIPTDKAPNEWYVEDPHLLGTDGQDYLVRVEDARRLAKPIPWKPPKGVIRIGKLPGRYQLLAPLKSVRRRRD